MSFKEDGSQSAEDMDKGNGGTKGKIDEVGIQSSVQQAWSNTVTEEVNASETHTVDDNLALLYPRQQLFEGSDLDSDSSRSDAGKEFGGIQSRPQVIIDLTSVDSSSERKTVSRPGVIVAAASSSNIGDLTIKEDCLNVTVEKLENNGVLSSLEEPLVLSMTATESTSEDLVSSTSETRQKIILAYLEHRTTYPSPFCHTRTPPGQLIPNLDYVRNGLNVPGEPNGNTEQPTGPTDGDDGEDDDSSGIIPKDETDSAEEESDENELTDSASETEGGCGPAIKHSKPVITISDQNYPRLVINFGEEDKGIKPNGTGDVGNNNSIKDCTNIPIQNWVESVQRHNKRKRTDSERLELEELP